MKKKKKNQSLEENPQEKKDPKESIPLWLQGLSERQKEQEDEAADEWRKEEDFLDKNIESVSDEELDSSDEEPVDEVIEYLDEEEEKEDEEPDQDDLPDWLNELADVNPDTPEISGQKTEVESDLNEEISEEEDDITEEVNVETVQNVESIEEMTLEQQPDQEDMVEEVPSLEVDEVIEEEFIPEDEEIPEWLREMIAAEERHIELESQKLIEEKADEPTRPVIIESAQELTEDELPEESEETDIFDREAAFDETPARGEFQLIEEMVDENEEVTEALSPDLQTPDLIDKQDDQYEYLEDLESASEDQPTSEEQNFEEFEDSAENKESLEEEEEPTPPIDTIESVVVEQEEEDLSGYEETPNGPVPKFLIAAKSSLENGDIDNALEIIYGFFTDSENLDQIKDWLYSAIESVDCDKSKLWEALGDIAIQQGKHAEAFNAYTKAIKNLENLKVEQNEIN